MNRFAIVTFALALAAGPTVALAQSAPAPAATHGAMSHAMTHMTHSMMHATPKPTATHGAMTHAMSHSMSHASPSPH